MTYDQLRSAALHTLDADDWAEIPEAHSAALVYAVLALAEAVRETGGLPAPRPFRDVSGGQP